MNYLTPSHLTCRGDPLQKLTEPTYQSYRVALYYSATRWCIYTLEMEALSGVPWNVCTVTTRERTAIGIANSNKNRHEPSPKINQLIVLASS